MQLFLHSASFVFFWCKIRIFSIPVKKDWTRPCSTFRNTENKNPNLLNIQSCVRQLCCGSVSTCLTAEGKQTVPTVQTRLLACVFYVNTIKWPMPTFLCATLDCKTVERSSCLEKHYYLSSFYPAAASRLFWSLSQDAVETAEIGLKLPEFEEMPNMSGGVSRETHFQKRYLDDSYLVPWWICGCMKTWLWIIHLLSTSCGVTWCREQAGIYFSYV